ncbi:MAG: S66 peptidase family protein, partial [Bacteroidota bacterium]
MITPTYLTPGDTIGIVSPAKHIDGQYIVRAREMLEKRGYRVVLGKHVLGRHHQFAGTDAERAADFQHMMDDAHVRMILCSRGGYGSARIIDLLNFRGFMRNPKWIAGFSDITVFHAHIYSVFGIESVHGIMPLDFPGSDSNLVAVDR